MDVVRRLENHHVKPSVQRIAIMKYLMEHLTHPTVDEIYTALSPTMPTLSKTTVYNTLRLLSAQGAIQALTIDEHFICYDAETTPHAHFQCKRCGKIFDVEDVKQQMKAVQIEGHYVEEIHFYYKGICKDCLKEESDNTEITNN